MSASECNETDILASPNEQPARQNISPPFSEKLSVDERLQLSHENFKQTIEDFFIGRDITPLSQLTSTPSFPTPHVLAQFAYTAYKDYIIRESVCQCERRLVLPDGWELLTTASNSRCCNGYFGAAYWHPEHQQVVIAHRGTQLRNCGALWTDCCGVVCEGYVPQMRSASTFAYKVVKALREVNEGMGISFQMFFTGHSLGGWLAQVTTFTTEYLKREGKFFLASNNDGDCYHPHTVVFDSPGCKDMLSRMKNTYFPRQGGRSSIKLKHLDVTSYLSAPNRINTCNQHVGIVYRIFPQLDMSWWEEHTALYNFATHSMKRIVEAFDPKTGQVYEDEQGKLKIQVVVDWPLTAGLSRCEEYKRFFEWAKDFKNYHPEITDEYFLIQGYHPIHYQTKAYDKVTRISIFSTEERRFLEDYRRIFELPEVHKPKELFSEMRNNQAEEEAERKLQNLQLEEDTIHCADASALQTLITYVKRLLQLFPQIKQNTNCAFSTNEIRNNVYQIGTKHYLEKFQQSPLEFKSDALSLSGFLNSDEQKVLQLRMVDGDAWKRLMKVHQVLEETPSRNNFLSESRYTVLTLEHLLLVNRLVNLNKSMESTKTPHLLIISCETNQGFNDEIKGIFESLLTTLRQKQSIKIILTTQSENEMVTSLQDKAEKILCNGYVTKDEKLTLRDLTTSSQNTLLGKPVKFQGDRILLEEIMSAETPVGNFLPLCVLLQEEELMIADPVQIPDDYDESYYIGRTLHLQKSIKKEISNDKCVRDSHEYLDSTEQGFRQLCKLNPKSNEHCLHQETSGKLLCQERQGSLEKLHEYIDIQSPQTYTPNDLKKLLEQAQHQRVMLISDPAGMGKSTLLTHLSKQIKKSFPAKWVLRIDLNDHTDALETLKNENIDKEKSIEFVLEKVLKLEPGLDKELLKYSCEKKQKLRMVIMLDGFDEISPDYKEAVIDLLQALMQTAVEQLWVTTRPHLREDLEDKLQQPSYTLEPFSEQDQVDFLTNFWSLKHRLTEGRNKAEEEGKKNLQDYAKEVIMKLAQSVGDSDFNSIPLHCRILAEVFDEEVKTFCQSDDPELVFHVKIDLFGSYKKFIEGKYHIYRSRKSQSSRSNVPTNEMWEYLLKVMIEDHHLLALRALFTEEQATLFESNSDCKFSVEKLSRIGIVEVTCDGEPHFIHRTYVDYYVADFFVNKLTKGKKTSPQVETFVLKDIFLKAEYSLIRAFLDGLLSISKPSSEVLKQYGNRTHQLWKDGLLQIHQAAVEGNANIVGFLLDSLQAAEHTDTVNELLLELFSIGGQHTRSKEIIEVC